MRKWSLFIGAITAVVAGSSWHSGKRVEEFYQSHASTYSNHQLIRMERGIFRSTAYFKHSNFSDAPPSLEYVLQVDIEHGPFPWSSFKEGDFTPYLARVHYRPMAKDQTLKAGTRNAWPYAHLVNADELPFEQLTLLNYDFSQKIKARFAEIKIGDQHWGEKKIHEQISADQQLQTLDIGLPFLRIDTAQGVPVTLQNTQLEYQWLSHDQRLLFIRSDEINLPNINLDHVSISQTFSKKQDESLLWTVDALLTDVQWKGRSLGSVALNYQTTTADKNWIAKFDGTLDAAQTALQQLAKNNPQIDIHNLQFTNLQSQESSHLAGQIPLTSILAVFDEQFIQHWLGQPQPLNFKLKLSEQTYLQYRQLLGLKFHGESYQSFKQKLLQHDLIRLQAPDFIVTEVLVSTPDNIVINGHHFNYQQLKELVSSLGDDV